VATFIVYRHRGSGPDAADKRAVARVEAGSPEEACRLAASGVTLAVGQTLTAEPAELADAQEAQRNRTSRDLARDTRGGVGPTPEG
jgi:hypothetical protein